MEIFIDLISTLSVVLPIFLVVLVLSIGIVMAVLWLWDRRNRPEPQGPVADWFDSYTEPVEPKQRMETLMRPAEPSSDHWIDKLLTKYQLGLEVDADAGVVRLTDRKFFELKNKVVEFPVARAVGLDQKAAKKLCMAVRSTFNRRAQRQGIMPVKHRGQEVSAA